MAPLFKGVSAKTPANSQQGSTALESLPADLRGHRSIIYDLFELYQDEVRGMNGFDLLDLVFHIWTQVLIVAPKLCPMPRLSHMDAGVSQRVLRCRVWAAEPYAAQQSYLYADLSML